MDFKDIIGQSSVIESLKRALSQNRVGHAYIFTGPEGMGKRTIAHIFAGLLLCENPGEVSICGNCKACRLYRNDTNPDYQRISANDSSIGVDRIRGIQKDVSVKPLYSKRKVYIIEEGFNMTDQAQNCLLKTFEEPPDFAVIIILTTNYKMLRETIRSRAQRVDFRKYTGEQVMEAISRSCDLEMGIIKLVADYADGNIGAALELAGSREFTLHRDKIFKLMNGVAGGKVDDVLEFTDFMDENKENAKVLLDIIMLYYRDLLLLSEIGKDKSLINIDKKDIMFCNARSLNTSKAIRSIEAVEATYRAIMQNANYRLAIDDMVIRLRG